MNTAEKNTFEDTINKLNSTSSHIFKNVSLKDIVIQLELSLTNKE